MNRKLIGLITILVGVSLLLAACGGGGKKIAIGPPGSATNTVSKMILDAYGVGSDDYEEFQEGFGDAADLVQDGNIDISVGVLGIPAGSIASLQANAGDVVMLEISDEALDKIEANSEYKRYTIPKDTYDFLDKDINTIAAYAILMANTNTIDDELGYELARIMVEHGDEISHAQGIQLTLENALNGAEGLPIHPGAARYYEEQGLEFDNPIADLAADAGDRKTEFILGTGSQGGTYYPLGGEIASLWNNHLDTNYTNQETGASVENMALISTDEMDLGMAVHVPALEAVNGEGDDFGGSPVENAAFIGHIYPEIIQIITRESTKIKSLSDLK